MPKCTADELGFGRLGRRRIEANFAGGALSSDGGLMLLRQVDRRIGLSAAAAAALHDPRHPDLITQPPVWAVQVRQPGGQSALRRDQSGSPGRGPV